MTLNLHNSSPWQTHTNFALFRSSDLVGDKMIQNDIGSKSWPTQVISNLCVKYELQVFLYKKIYTKDEFYTLPSCDLELAQMTSG